MRVTIEVSFDIDDPEDLRARMRAALAVLETPPPEPEPVVEPVPEPVVEGSPEDFISQFITLDELCAIGKFGHDGYRALRRQGKAPTAYKMGRRLMFLKTEVDEWFFSTRLKTVGRID